MKSSFCSFVPSHSPAVSLLSNKVHSECHNATDPFLDWYLFICLFISESLLLIDFTTIPCFLLCFKTPYFPCSFVPNFFYEVHIWLSLAFFLFFLCWLIFKSTFSVACTSQYGCSFTVVDYWPWEKREIKLITGRGFGG